MNTYRLRSLDPLLFGDGRPFSADAGTLSARSLSYPMPGTVAGALRNRYAQQTRATRYDPRIAQAEFQGPLLTVGGVPYLPVPLDAIQVEADGQPALRRALPNPEDAAHTDVPDGIAPCTLELGVGESPSKEQPKGYWSIDTMDEWLSAGALTGEPISLAPLEVDSRLHVAIDPKTLANQKGMLFRTEGVSIGGRMTREPREPEDTDLRRDDDLGLSVRFEYDLQAPDCLTLGGERRLGTVLSGDPSFWTPPARVAGQWNMGRRACMVLVTPAQFRDGWNPGEVHGLRPCGACVGRRVAYSGWRTPPKDEPAMKMPDLRWLAPAGSVYFFDGMPGKDLADLWLKPVGEGGRDGFGLAVWGVW